jgi:hypothetical protein
MMKSFGSMSLALDDVVVPRCVDPRSWTWHEGSSNLIQQAKSRGSFLADIDTDTDTDDDDEGDELSQRHHWQALKTAFEAQNYATSTATTSGAYSKNSWKLMPPSTQPLFTRSLHTKQQSFLDVAAEGQFVIPVTHYDRDFSQTSVLTLLEDDDMDCLPAAPAPHESSRASPRQRGDTHTSSFDEFSSAEVASEAAALRQQQLEATAFEPRPAVEREGIGQAPQCITSADSPLILSLTVADPQQTCSRRLGSWFKTRTRLLQSSRPTCRSLSHSSKPNQTAGASGNWLSSLPQP